MDLLTQFCNLFFVSCVPIVRQDQGKTLGAFLASFLSHQNLLRGTLRPLNNIYKDIRGEKAVIRRRHLSEHSQRWEGQYRIKVVFFTWLKFYHKFKCLCRHHCYTGCTYLGSSIFIKIARSLNSISVFIVSLSNVSFCCKKVKVKDCIFF